MKKLLIAFLNTVARLFIGDKNAAERQKGQRKQTDQRFARDAHRQADEGERK
jgi:hypothetical protein